MAIKEHARLKTDINKLATFLLDISPSGVPCGEGEGAIDVAIKYIKEAAHWVRKLEEKNIELWATKMKLEQAHVELFDAHKRLWEELKGVEREREKNELAKALKYYKSAGRIDIVEPADDCLCDYCMATRRIRAALNKVDKK